MSENNEQEERARQALLALGSNHPAVVLILDVLRDLEAAAVERERHPLSHTAPGGDRGVSYYCGGAAFMEVAVATIEDYLNPQVRPDDKERLQSMRLARMGGGT